jgi:hypothetical protein
MLAVAEVVDDPTEENMPEDNSKREEARKTAALKDGTTSIVAAALNLVGSHAIFGRNWWVMT